MLFKPAIFANYFWVNNVYCESVFTSYRYLFSSRKSTGLSSLTLWSLSSTGMEMWSQSVQMRIKPHVWKAMSNWRNSFKGESLLLAFLTQSSKVLGVLGSHQLQREFRIQYFLSELGVQKWGSGDNEDDKHSGKEMLYVRKHFFSNFFVCHGLCSDKKWHRMAVRDCKI